MAQEVPPILQGSKRGFAAMDPERRSEIARKGGSSVPADKRSYSKNRELAAAAGAKGGKATRGTYKKPVDTL